MKKSNGEKNDKIGNVILTEMSRLFTAFVERTS